MDDLSDQFIKIADKYDQFTQPLKISAALSFYHYTSPKGLLGILDHEDGIHLHFTRMDCINDQSEGKLITEHYREACKELLSSKKISKIFYSEIITLCPSNKRAIIYQRHDVDEDTPVFSLISYIPYACCFSKDQDSLPMWNYYVKDSKYQGYNIKLCSHVFGDFFKSTLQGIRTRELELFQVKYADEQKTEIFKRLILDLYPFQSDNAEILGPIKNIITSFLTKQQLQYKSCYFRHENEIRAILYVPQEIPLDATNYTARTIQYRDVNGLIVPYTDVVLPYKKWLVGATIGPLINDKTAKETLSSFLKEKSYNRCTPDKILNSEVPIRF